MPVTSIVIDSELLQDAKELLDASSDKEVVERALRYMITMQRQRLAFERISEREFTASQINAKTINYPV